MPLRSVFVFVHGSVTHLDSSFLRWSYGIVLYEIFTLGEKAHRNEAACNMISSRIWEVGNKYSEIIHGVWCKSPLDIFMDKKQILPLLRNLQSIYSINKNRHKKCLGIKEMSLLLETKLVLLYWLLFVFFRLGGEPYPGIKARDIANLLEKGFRMRRPKQLDKELLVQTCTILIART